MVELLRVVRHVVAGDGLPVVLQDGVGALCVLLRVIESRPHERLSNRSARQSLL